MPAVGQGVATVGFQPFYRDGTLRPFAIYVFEPTVTPEPGTLLMFAWAGVVFVWRSRSRARLVSRAGLSDSGREKRIRPRTTPNVRPRGR